MQLSYSPTSPFVRKVLVFAQETGLADRITPVRVDFRNEQSGYTDINPLSKVPALTLDDGMILIDSAVICDYLDSLHAGQKLIPITSIARWRALQLQAIANGIMDAGVLRIIEQRRPPELRSSNFDGFQARKQQRAVIWLEQHAEWLTGPVTIGQISVACALSWLDFRFPAAGWREQHPQLEQWDMEFARRPAMTATVFKDE